MKPPTDPWSAAPAEVQSCVHRLRKLVPHLVARVHPTTPLETCGFDSLELVELLCAIESATGVRLAVEDADGRTTGAELFTRIAERTTPTATRPH